MSMYLSAANRAAGIARSHATAEVSRQQAAATSAMARQITDFWLGGWAAPTNKNSKKTRRR